MGAVFQTGLQALSEMAVCNVCPELAVVKDKL